MNNLARFYYKEAWRRKLTKDEEIILSSDPEYSYCYALDILKKPWPLGERAIASSSYHAFCYAKYVLEAPFLLGEQTIASDPDPDWACYYSRDILKLPKDKVGVWAINYLKNNP